MIVGIGVDVVDIERFRRTIERTPRLRDKLFTEPERDMPIESLAARFAAKEAIAKALGSPGGMLWHDVTIRRATGQRPTIEAEGTVAATASDLGVRVFHLSLSHDGPVATAMVVAEG
ncbi:holo-ACP synthase [Timonella sp. A28]|uniref:holo-ACP synthase n=1 Tax=Timonella sp. A28 TaxID=3442640 RepID=UPI003EBCA91C